MRERQTEIIDIVRANKKKEIAFMGKYDEFFGFSQAEVDKILADTGLTDHIEEIRAAAGKLCDEDPQ